MSIGSIERELARRVRRAATLTRARNRLMAKVAAMDAQIAELGGSVRSAAVLASGKRFQNEMTLPDALARALKGKSMSIGESADAVKKLGFRTASRTFNVPVNLALSKDKRIKRVARGRYTLR